jgi:thiamine-monophosphate kinase
MREFDLIENFFKPLTKFHKAAQNLSDDVAKISLKKNEELAISKDIFVENVHFRLCDGGFKIAAKLLRSNLSDLAASGAAPLYYMLGFSKNKNTDSGFVKEFVRGLQSVQDEFKLYLIGGDTVKSKKLFFSITIFGVLKKNKTLSRNQAKAGDLIFLSGTIGDAFLGLISIKSSQYKNVASQLPQKILLPEPLVDNSLRDHKTTKSQDLQSDEYLRNRHFFPTPRIELGKKLLEKNLSKCAIDVSDGLLADLKHVCQASQLDAEIYLEKIIISKAAKKFLTKNSQITILDLLSGGDDYELVFTSNPKNRQKIQELAKNLRLQINCIGQLKKTDHKKNFVTLKDKKNKKIKIKKFGYEH